MPDNNQSVGYALEKKVRSVERKIDRARRVCKAHVGKGQDGSSRNSILRARARKNRRARRTQPEP